MFQPSRYKITDKGVEANASFKFKLKQWLEGALDLPYSTKEGMVLAIFGEDLAARLSLKDVYDMTDMLPNEVNRTMERLLKQELIEKAR